MSGSIVSLASYCFPIPCTNIKQEEHHVIDNTTTGFLRLAHSHCWGESLLNAFSSSKGARILNRISQGKFILSVEWPVLLPLIRNLNWQYMNIKNRSMQNA
jgi:hypothetical protein